MFQPEEREYVERARVGRLATTDGEGRPHVVPLCFALDGDTVVSAIDEKPQDVSPDRLTRLRNIDANPRVMLVVDHYTEDWSELGWVQLRGTAERCRPGDAKHADGVSLLRAKYDQYVNHDLERRPLVSIAVGSVQSWGRLDCAADE